MYTKNTRAKKWQANDKHLISSRCDSTLKPLQNSIVIFSNLNKNFLYHQRYFSQKSLSYKKSSTKKQQMKTATKSFLFFEILLSYGYN